MAVLLQEYTTEVVAANGTTYTVLSYGEERDDGTWTGWLEFEPTDDESAGAGNWPGNVTTKSHVD